MASPRRPGMPARRAQASAGTAGRQAFDSAARLRVRSLHRRTGGPALPGGLLEVSVVKQAKLTYDPAARFDVDSTEVVYRDDGQTQWPMTVFRPRARGPFPALLRVHGGAWNVGDREGNARIDRALAECGMVVAAIEFRRAPDHPYPAQVQDTNSAVRWPKLHASDFDVDPACFGGAGDSSGGHTMMLSAMRPDDPAYAALPLDGGDGVDASVAYVIALCSVLDPYTRYFYDRSDGKADRAERAEAYFLTTATMKQANPQMILERGEVVRLPPTLIIQGDADDNIPNNVPLMFEEAYTAAGGSLQLEWFSGMPHQFARDPGAESDRAIAIMRSFIARQIAAGAS